MKNPLHWLAYILVSGLLFSCDPVGPESKSDYDLLLSAYDEEFIFSEATSFIMPDTLVFLNDSTATELIEISENQAQEILSAVRNNLTGYGWVDSTGIGTKSETLVLVSAVVALYSDNIWQAWNWHEQLENVDPIGQTPKYPWYPESFPYLYDFRRGTLLITMLNAQSLATTTENPDAIWIGSIDGVVEGQSVNSSKLVQDVDLLFELSTVLHK
jgi:hypothetical protein